MCNRSSNKDEGDVIRRSYKPHIMLIIRLLMYRDGIYFFEEKDINSMKIKYPTRAFPDTNAIWHTIRTTKGQGGK